MLCLFLTIVGLLGGPGHARYASGQDALMYPSYQDLLQDSMAHGYKDQYDNSLYPHGLYETWQPDDNIQVSGREMGRASLRDQEYLEHSSNNDGYQYISGGAGEGEQHLKPEGTQENTQEVKSDEDLPFYCHPPNPCPKGYKEKDGCQKFIEDTAESQQAWISEMQFKDMCPCDEEHMFSCPEDKVTDDQSNYIQDASLNKVIDELLKGNGIDNPYMLKESKREGLVAKKSPREEKTPIMKRSIRQEKRKVKKSGKYKQRSNPYLTGEKLKKRVVKKG